MSYNKYNTRNSGRYNIPGQFVPASEETQYEPPYNNAPSNQAFAPTSSVNMQNIQTIQTNEVDMKPSLAPPPLPPLPPAPTDADMPSRPPWMKTKLEGVRKLTTKERRRRQNENLRRLLTPKNALMVLNEMTSGDNLAQNFKVEQAPAVNNFSYNGKPTFNFCADLTIDGVNFKGYGENKMMARNAAAEQALRDIFLKKMNKYVQEGGVGGGGSEAGSESGGAEEPLPMIQLASFALQKLFAEWEYEGHKVPQLRPGAEVAAPAAAGPGVGTGAAGGGTRPAGAAPRSVLPSNAAALHPCSLLTYMRPGATYTQLAADGDRPQNVLYTMGVEVDGTMFVGKAQNKKEARKLAARSACEKLFQVTFDAAPSASAPLPPK